MKTKELIALLQKEDPSGELECCVDNSPIMFISCQPSYYDGTLRKLILDETGSVSGIKFITSGSKIRLQLYDYDDLIADDPDAVIDFSECSNPKRYKEIVDKQRAESREVNDQINEKITQSGRDESYGKE